MKIAILDKADYPQALQFVFRVFLEYEAPDYPPCGVETFRKSVLENQAYQDSLTIYGAYDGARLVGVIATRNGGCHIALFFVDGSYHRRGIGKLLFAKVVSDCEGGTITVNASPYATEVYHHLGFVDTDTEQMTDGMRYTPMQYER
ncbi:MAG: GNAT family N-acetyltransferase [Oscillibacter sp.]|jgi:GNAT superfamily N-acetyltransferase|nr:GNAT family N-acetyltransferase [Oscillibacter sp.]